MGHNVEVKARARNFERQMLLALGLTGLPAEHLVQEDTFFNVSSGRLKLRNIADRFAELIHYDRADSLEPKESRYTVCRVDNPEELKDVFLKTLGIRGVVRKKRTVVFVGQTRIHLDEVEGLGEFIELEVVLEFDQDIQYGRAVAEILMSKLEIEKRDLVGAAYVELLYHLVQLD